MDLNNPSTNPITLRRSRRLNNQKTQSSNISCESSSNSLPTNHITKIYPLRSRLRRESLTSNNPTTTTNRRARTSKQEDLSSMGLRNGKIVNLRSVISGSTSQTAQELTSSTLPLLAFNPLPRHHHQTTNSSSLSSYSSINSNNNNNNNNNNEFNSSTCQYHYSNITNHPSLDSTQYFPVRLDIVLDRLPASREKQIEYGWNHDDRSMNIFVKHNDPCTFHRHVSHKKGLEKNSHLSFFVLQPVAQSTDAVRCKKGFTNGIHVWEIEW